MQTKKVKLILTVLILGFMIGAVMYFNERPEPTKKITTAVEQTLAMQEYRFVINISRYDDVEQYIGTLSGEKKNQNVHILWKIKEDEIELYQIGSDFYRRVNAQNWLTINQLDYTEAVCYFQEMDPLYTMIRLKNFEGEYLGKEKLDGKRFGKYQAVSFDSMGKNWENSTYTLWIKDNLIHRCEMMLSEKNSDLVWIVEMVLDFSKRAEITAPI